MIPNGYIRFRKDALGFEFRKRIKEELTIVPKLTSSFVTEVKVIRMYHEEDEHFAVPRGYFNEFLLHRVDEFEFVPSLGSNSLSDLQPISLRGGQEEWVSRLINALNHVSHANPKASGAILEASMGTGKTVMGLETARRLGLKTLVIVNSTILFCQWSTEIKKFFPNARIGTIQGPKIEIEDKDIVVGMLQSLALKDDYPASLFESFGTLIIDETHKVASPEFSKILLRFNARYLIGLSGTLKRSDGAENVFKYGIGGVISGTQKLEVLTPHVYFVDTGYTWNSLNRYEEGIDKLKQEFLKSVIVSEERNHIIIEQAKKAAKSGRNILILSERVQHIQTLCVELQKCGFDAKLLIGSTPENEREIAKKAQIVCATSQLVGTGFNEPRLDTLIYATPIQEVFQSTGRILRTYPGKKQPIVVDLVDSKSKVSMILAKSRRKRYLSKAWEIKGGESTVLRDISYEQHARNSA